MTSRLFVAVLLVALQMSFAAPVFAQQDVDEMDVAGAYSLTTSSYAMAITVPVGLTVLVAVLLLRSSSEMESYIKENSVALQHDLHMGGGETSAELAMMFNVPAEQHAEFAQVLTENRGELLPLTDVDALTPQRAGTFVRVIYNALMEKPEFAQHLPRIGA
ncbi:DUF3015 domain-containing protein [Lujinxingia vulgaris]|uniref:DUF3015 domain-containing protein n=1 Tax=Lujinxingia vulgaris TaxID=2600176 RepID=A0A5C6X385_9DELT|nr:DUF3015 family protein [Lujinxingia vulgaris]TXD34730.1 DUF3015 domain-containing protein [Lujinxingia vulgaris]